MFCLVLIASLLVTACGKLVPARLPLTDGRIAGGEDAEIEDIPYQAGLFFKDSYICGGSILSEDVVVTAAGCFRRDKSQYRVYVGTNKIYISGDNQAQVVDINKVVVHPKYNHHTYNYDAALLFLSSSLKLGPTVRPVALPDQGQEIADNTPVVASGWGELTEYGYYSRVLQKVTLPIVNQKVCESAYEIVVWDVTSAMICAGIMDMEGKGTCMGDIGGPLVENGTLVGIISWVLGCGDAELPGVSTRVAAISDWIKNELS